MTNGCQGGVGLDLIVPNTIIGRTESLSTIWSATTSIHHEQILRNQCLGYGRSRNLIKFENGLGERSVVDVVPRISMTTVRVPCRVPAGL
jgi:hypothetical protein